MKRFFALIIVIITFILLQGCRGNGSSAPAPTNVNVVEGDSSVTVSWDMLPGVEYWVFKAAGTNVTPQSCYGMPQCQMIMKAVSPTVVSGLANGTAYSFTVNGRIDGGKGGAGSPSIQATPRLAGASWSVGTSLGAFDLHGVTYGSVFVAVGTNGALFSSTNGVNWIPPTTINWTTTPATLPDFNAASYYGGTYVTVGTGGVLLTSADAITWTQQTGVSPGNDLYSVASNGAGGYVATGANGTIINSSNAKNWTAATSSGTTTSALYAVTYANGMYVAAGASGTLLASTDGNIWNPPASISSSISSINLRGIAYGAGIFVALGDNGTLVTSADGTNWTLRSSSPSATLVNAVTYGRQFVAVDNAGTIFTSTDGLAWAQATSPTSSPLYAVTHGPYNYSAVGAAGLNIYSM